MSLSAWPLVTLPGMLTFTPKRVIEIPHQQVISRRTRPNPASSTKQPPHGLPRRTGGRYWKQLEPGLKLWPVTRPDPTRTLFTLWPDPVIECLCFKLSDYFDDGVLLMNAFCQKSLVYAANIQMTKISNIIVSSCSLARSLRVILLQNYKNRVCHTDPWPDPTRPKSLTRWPVTRTQRPGSNTDWKQWQSQQEAFRQGKPPLSLTLTMQRNVIRITAKI